MITLNKNLKIFQTATGYKERNTGKVSTQIRIKETQKGQIVFQCHTKHLQGFRDVIFHALDRDAQRFGYLTVRLVLKAAQDKCLAGLFRKLIERLTHDTPDFIRKNTVGRTRFEARDAKGKLAALPIGKRLESCHPHLLVLQPVERLVLQNSK